MNHRTINLARNLVYSSETRRRVYRLMMLYLSCCIVLLSVLSNIATRCIQQGLTFRKHAREIQREFERENSSEQPLPSYAKDLKIKMGRHLKELEAIHRALPATIHTCLPLLVALAHQADGGELHTVRFLQQDEFKHPALEFSIRLPNSSNAQPDLIQTWQTNPVLKQQFAAITPTNTQRDQIGNSPVLIMSYRATFNE